MEQRWRFSVLGPVRAWRDETEVELGSPQQRLVLATLLLAEGAQVSVPRLTDAVWGTETPASAPGVLRTYVHRLRKALHPTADAATSVIRSAGEGYRLRTPVESDLRDFRDLCTRAEQARAQGDTAGAVKHLREASGLWHGTALAGLRGEYARHQRRRLTELRLTAQATRLTAELDLGTPAEATAELAGLVAGHPLDERFRALLMLAYYRSGRQAAALATYREAQRLLAEQLGVDPGPALQTLYERLLRADPTLLTPQPPAHAGIPAQPPAEPRPDPNPTRAPRTPAPPVPSQLPPGLPVFVGRTAELREAEAQSANGTLVVSAVAGMAGVGKTAFAVHWARRIATRFPDGQLYLNLRGFDPVGLPVAPEHALRTLLASLGADLRGLPQELDALAATYRTLLSGRQVLVLLDNARDAAQVRPLLPGAPGCLAIVTSRDRLPGLVAVDGAHPLHLDVLTPAEAHALLTRRLGAARVEAEPDAVDEIITHCARLPLALAVTAARAATRPALTLTALAAELRDSAADLDAFQGHGDSAADVRAVFSWSYRALTPDAARLFRLLAVHPGPDTTAAAAASLTGHALPHTRRLLTELVQTHLLDEPTPGRYASHDLLRTYAGELAHSLQTPEDTRAARHRALDHYLHTAHRAAALTNRARALIPLEPAAQGVRPEEFGEDAGKATAWCTAEQAVLIAAVEQATAHHFDTHTWQLAWAVANHLHLRGLWQEEEAMQSSALTSARRLGDRVAEAYAHRGLGLALAGRGLFDRAAAEARQAIDLFTAAGDIRAAAESHRTLAWSLEQNGDLESALDAAEQSLSLFRASEGRGADERRSRTAIASALNAVGWGHVLLGRYGQALDHCRQALALCLELGDDINAAHTWDSVGYAHHHLGQYDEAVPAFHQALALYRRQGDLPWFVASALTHLGDTHLSAGSPDAAHAAWTEALTIMDDLGHTDAESLRTRLNPDRRR
ncbi:AfsR/SARP family transcriptional regulator [Streptomyces zaehneri]|uniref:AfsR/SARP family transcriptional regulator n=1 Tax=Streptomyces zaehneri TaxID=3051180 RepID=UPI0028D28669|nr:BTAD domain-containing putative transcriptional regulator [Streptomyces sp. DSM 40713]